MNSINSTNKKLVHKRKKSGLFFPLFMLSFTVVLLLSVVYNDVNSIIKKKTETTELSVKYNALLEEEASLNSEVTKLQDPEYIARYAREKYLYTKDGERILKIVDSQPSNDKNSNITDQLENSEK
jgi:cell division protein DivIC